MNAQRRKAIAKIKDQLDDLRLELEELAQEERDAFGNLPESIQYSERGEAMEQAADGMDEQASNLQDIIDALDEIVDPMM